MIIQELDGYYRRLLEDPELDVPKHGWSTERAAWELGLSEDGSVVSVTPLTTGDGKDMRKFVDVSVPEHGARSGTRPKPFFLCDTAAYLLGLDEKNGSEKREYARTLHHAVLDGCEGAAASAVLNFFDKEDVLDNIDSARQDDLKSGFIVFRMEDNDIDKLRIHEHPEIVAAWNTYCDQSSSGETMGQCSITGETTVLNRLFPQVSGIPGAQSAGASIVSFNCDSFESYGKKQAFNASISKDVAFNAGSALKYLYRHREHRIKLGDTMILFWTDRSAPHEMELIRAIFDLDSTLYRTAEDAMELDRLGNVFSAMARGLPLDAAEYDLDTRFFVLGLSPNAARLSVRFFETDTLERLTENFGLYLQDTNMADVRPCSLRSMLLQVAPLGKDDEIPSTMMNACFTAMISGGLFPQSLYNSILSRMRCDHAAKNPWDMGRRAALLKACLVRKQRLGLAAYDEGSLDVGLNHENRNKGYLLGRLFAVMEYAQRSALGDVNATIRDKYIGAASTTPARVYPHLFHSMDNYVSGLRKNKRGLGVVVERAMDEIVPLIDGDECLPATLNTNDQGQFYIGYYQQRATFWTGSRKSEDGSLESEDEPKELD